MIRLYNTLTKKQDFLPHIRILHGTLQVYACGVTVYDHCHTGHARSYVSWDVLRRWLEFRGRPVKYVQNFTDIDDKIVAKAQAEGVTCKELSDRYIASYFEDMDWLNVRRADAYPRVSEYFWAMAGFVNEMIKRGLAYEVADGVAFNGKSCPNYGQLSGKKECEDFALWKKKGESEFPGGRPGWHLECSVMIRETLGETIDIHCGGADLIFPHHENEIAQSECFHGKPLAHIWLHNGFVEYQGKKASKSEGNVVYLNKLREIGMDPDNIRLWILQAHYRQPIAQHTLSETYMMWRSLRHKIMRAPDKGITKGFIEAMDDDLNTPVALAELQREPSKEMAEILGFRVAPVEQRPTPDIQELADQRAALRKEKRWAEADAVRDTLISKGWQVHDGFDGSVAVSK
jgi:cysteinyl-tRNA synthetase